MGADLADLQALRAWCRSAPRRPIPPIAIERIVRRLGQVAVPLLGRELRSSEAPCREAARGALAIVATAARDRVVAELQAVAACAKADEPKLSALALLAELGIRGNAQFSDPYAIQRRSAAALASQLESRADVASAADLVVRSLGVDKGEDIIQLLVAMRAVAPEGAAWLADELAVRLDLDAAIRMRIVDGSDRDATAPDPEATARRQPRPTRVAVLVDAAARLVVVASRKVNGERRWRRWAVLIGQAGVIDDCLYHDALDDGEAATELVGSLCADGYRVASSDPDHARTIVTAAARLTGVALGSPYYLGRDLLDLDDAHVSRGVVVSQLGRAVELLATGDRVQAEALLARCDGAKPDVAAALAACAFARGDHAAAIEPLERALVGEPDWPLHHWNLGVAHHALGDVHGAYHALRRFVATSAARTGLYADPDQPGRVACAERLLVELERTARLTGTSLRKRRRTRKSPVN